MKRMVLLTGLLLLAATGCYSVPFEQAKLMPVQGVSPEEVRRNFIRRLAPVYESEDSLVFRVLWKKIAVLGYTRVDRESHSYEAVCLNHVGVMLFHLSGDGRETELQYGLQEFKEHSEFTERIGADIRRISFDLVPGQDAEVKMRSKRVIFREEREDGLMEYVFGGPNMLLLEKSFLRKGWFRWSQQWRVRYFEYRKKNGYVYPRGIVLYNRKNHYRLVVRRRSITFGGKEQKELETEL